jgi:hypothetical protein
MVLSWDFDYTDDQGREVTTRTSQELIREVTYPVAMHELINSGLKSKDRLTENYSLFRTLAKLNQWKSP